ncbi:hypothetical protein TNCV_1696971 [Trichonephila clavipes]|nr:hypothetical protein TNCV_1696971 [Trichonephila clavipes]
MLDHILLQKTAIESKQNSTATPYSMLTKMPTSTFFGRGSLTPDTKQRFSRSSACSSAPGSDCEISSEAFGGGTERIRIAVTKDLLDMINTEPSILQLLAVPDNENEIKGIMFTK